MPSARISRVSYHFNLLAVKKPYKNSLTALSKIRKTPYEAVLVPRRRTTIVVRRFRQTRLRPGVYSVLWAACACCVRFVRTLVRGVDNSHWPYFLYATRPVKMNIKRAGGGSGSGKRRGPSRGDGDGKRGNARGKNM